MKMGELFRRAARRRRTAVIVAFHAAIALTIGAGVVLASSAGGRGIGVHVSGPLPRAPQVAAPGGPGRKVFVGHSYHNDTSAALRTMSAAPLTEGYEMEASPNPRAVTLHQDAPDTARQTQQFAPSMPAPGLNFDGIPFPGVSCNCAPPDTNGEVGATQYVQMVNEGFQVFNKSTGASMYGPAAITTLWWGAVYVS